MSANIVVAGPGGLGKHVLDALLASNHFNVTVFSRSPKPALEEKGAVIKVVDYNKIASLRAALKSAQADTLLSFMVDLQNPSLTARSHRNLLDAAVAEDVKRFVPAEYANDVARFPVPPSSEADKMDFREHAGRVCRTHGIEYTVFCVGIIMDFFLPRGKKKYMADLPPEFPNLLPVDAEAEPPVVKILGDSRDKVSMTLADDIASGVVRLLRLPRGTWGEFTYLSGDRVSWEDAAEILERVARKPVQRVHVSLEELTCEVGKAREAGDAIRIECAELSEAFGNGSEILPANAKCFEDLITTKFEDVMEKHYGNRRLS
ncbi:hypothetical protein F4808DRAFT_111225 [Astrocystis sublimbata]|nr:hypothetical protein F4808DRAFT_111225 [Astrocystis sublimbata]